MGDSVVKRASDMPDRKFPKGCWIGCGGLFLVFLLLVALAPDSQQPSTQPPPPQAKQPGPAVEPLVEAPDTITVTEQPVDADQPNQQSTPDAPEQPASPQEADLESKVGEEAVVEPQLETLWTVIRVIDGDTIDVTNAGDTNRIRLIGIDAPEFSECFGSEATAMANRILGDQPVILVDDPSQGNQDKYGRLLRYVVLSDGRDFGREMVKTGYAKEYTYSVAYSQQAEYRTAEAAAKGGKLGMWDPSACPTLEPIVPPLSAPENEASSDEGCVIKGNISQNGQLYHLPGCPSYGATKISESKGERWFCSEAEAVAAGWTKAGNCP
jgi:micrococcal nuclease